LGVIRPLAPPPPRPDLDPPSTSETQSQRLEKQSRPKRSQSLPPCRRPCWRPSAAIYQRGAHLATQRASGRAGGRAGELSKQTAHAVHSSTVMKLGRGDVVVTPRLPANTNTDGVILPTSSPLLLQVLFLASAAFCRLETHTRAHAHTHTRARTHTHAG